MTSYRHLGYHTLMCGDGTNDVGALKHAHVGVALLSTVRLRKGVEGDGAKSGDKEASSSVDNKLTRRPLRQQRSAHCFTVTICRLWSNSVRTLAQYYWIHMYIVPEPGISIVGTLFQ